MVCWSGMAWSLERAFQIVIACSYMLLALWDGLWRAFASLVVTRIDREISNEGRE